MKISFEETFQFHILTCKEEKNRSFLMLKSYFITKSRDFHFLGKRSEKERTARLLFLYFGIFSSTEKAKLDYFLLMKRLDLWNGVRLSKQMI